MPKLKINNTEIEVSPGTSILQAAELLGYEIPRFCYHDRLSVPANCRMCLVEVKGAPKPVASCAMACGENMEVFTQGALVEKSRRGVMEMLLINHPLDCPICDQVENVICKIKPLPMALIGLVTAKINGRFPTRNSDLWSRQS